MPGISFGVFSKGLAPSCIRTIYLPVADIGARTAAAGTGDLRARATEQ